jgi:predicted phosphodiesterase
MPLTCPDCGSKDVGTNGKLRYKCRECGKQWNTGKHERNVPKTPKHHHDEVFQKQILDLLEKKTIPVHHYHGDLVKFGVVGDTHIGSLYEHEDVLHLAYKIFREEGIKTVYHTGDICEGENMFPGQDYEIYAHGADAQVKACEQRYPRFKEINTYFITGSHDLSFYKRAGIDIGERITERRPDLIYLGREQSDVIIKTKHGEIVLRLVHPGKGTAYALSYHPQKYIESLSGGQKPNILLIGHYHKAEYLPCYRNIFTLQTGSIQGQSPFMKRQNLAAHVGFWTVEFRVADDNGIMRFKPEFFAHYEERIIERKIEG